MQYRGATSTTPPGRGYHTGAPVLTPSGRGYHRSRPLTERRDVDEPYEAEKGEEAREAQYALECVLARLSEDELRRILADLPPRAREHVRLTAADFPGEADLPF